MIYISLIHDDTHAAYGIGLIQFDKVSTHSMLFRISENTICLCQDACVFVMNPCLPDAISAIGFKPSTLAHFSVVVSAAMTYRLITWESHIAFATIGTICEIDLIAQICAALVCQVRGACTSLEILHIKAVGTLRQDIVVIFEAE